MGLSSTEAELVAIDDKMAQVLWTRHFFSAQGLFVLTTTIYQENKKKFYWLKMGRHQVAGEQDIWMFNTFL